MIQRFTRIGVFALTALGMAACESDEEEAAPSNTPTECPAGQQRVDGRCVVPATLGCTDEDAQNFDAAANRGDSSCIYSVTLTVDVSGFSEFDAGSGVSLSGDLDGNLTDNGDGTWSIQLELPQGSFAYRFANGTTIETVPMACAGVSSESRELNVGAEPILAAPLPFGACPPSDDRLALPLIVGDSYGPSGVFPDGDDVSLVVNFDCLDRPSDARGACYKWTYDERGGDAFAGANWLSGTSFADDVPLPVASGATEVSFYAWGAAGGEVVTFGFTPVEGNSESGGELKDQVLTDTPTRYSIKIESPYDLVQFPFFWSAGGQGRIEFWIADLVWNPTFGCTDESANNFSAEATQNDGSCLYDITFSVDVSNFDGFVEGDGVQVTGDVEFALTDSGDGIWSGTTELTPGDYSYAFANGAAVESVPDACSDEADRRTIAIESADLSIDLTEFGLCPVVGCADSDASNFVEGVTVDDGSCVYALTLAVDVTGFAEFDPDAGVQLAGDFVGDLVDQGDGIWSITLDVPPGTYAYRFANGSTSETVPDDCNNGSGDRPLTVGTAPANALPSPFSGCPTLTTFVVNMNPIPDFDPNDGVFVVGGVNVPMSDVDDDGVWEGNAALEPGTYSYNFEIGASPALTESVSVACGGPNRSVTVGSGSSTLPAVTFADCDRDGFPFVIDDFYSGRSVTLSTGATAPTETLGVGAGACPERAPITTRPAFGDCHTFSHTWGVDDATNNESQEVFFSIGDNFTNLGSRFLSSGATTLSFVAWGADGGSDSGLTVAFGAGLDGFDPAEDRLAVNLTGTPTRVEIPLTSLGPLYNGVRLPFGFIATPQSEGAEVSYEFYVDDLHWTRLASPNPLPEDREIQVVNGGAPVLAGEDIFGNVGEFGPNDFRSHVFLYQLPQNLKADDVVVAADFDVNLDQLLNTPTYDTDVYFIGVVEAPVVDPAWFFAGDDDPNFTKIQDGFVTPSDGVGRYQLDETASELLGELISAELSTGASPGDYVAIRFSPSVDSTGPDPVPTAYRFFNGGAPAVDQLPIIRLELACEECIDLEPQRRGCTDPAFANFDPIAWVDDGSCSNFPVIVSETHNPSGKFGVDFSLGDCSSTTRPEGARGVCYGITMSGVESGGALWVTGAGFGEGNNVPFDFPPDATQVSFFAWSDVAGTTVQFETKTDDPEGFTRPPLFLAVSGQQTLTTAPVRYTIPVAGEPYDEQPLQFPFGFSASGTTDTFYIDDIVWE